MKRIIYLLSIIVSTSTVAQYETTEDNGQFGFNQVVTLEKLNKFNLIGNGVQVGDYLPSAKLVTSSLQPYDTSTLSPQVKIYSILTSVDTPVCIQQAHELAQYVENNISDLNGITFYAVSADTPFAQQRFIREHDYSDSVTYLSDSSEHQFGLKTGAQIKELGLLTRSIIVTDLSNKIIHIQRVKELTTIPKLDIAVKIAKENLPT